MNPFDDKTDPVRHTIWHRLVTVDCKAFAKGDWSMIEDDFDANSFEGIRCFYSANPNDWRILFPDLPSYRQSWLEASAVFRALRPVGCSHFEALLARCHLNEIEIADDRALARKKFFGEVSLANGE